MKFDVEAAIAQLPITPTDREREKERRRRRRQYKAIEKTIKAAVLGGDVY